MATSNVVVPLKPQAVSTATTTALATGTLRPYNASAGALAPALPALSQVVDDDYLIVEKDSLDTSANAVTVTCASGDTFASGVTTIAMVIPGERVELQAATVNSTRVWKVKHHTIPRNGSDLRYFSSFKPEQYGAPATYSSSIDDTAAVQAAITAATAAGGSVLLSRRYRVPNGGLSTGPGLKSILGTGGLALSEDNSGTYTALSGIEVTSATAIGLAVHTPGIELVGFAVVNTGTATPTAGAGIQIVHSPSMSARRLDVANFFDDITFDSTFLADFNAIRCFDPVRYGVVWQQTANGDLGDSQFTGLECIMWAKPYQPTAGFRFLSGGGLRMISGKINGKPGAQNPNAGYFLNGILSEIADGVNTADLLISGWSIENISLCGIRLKQLNSTGNIANILINDNEFGYGGFAATVGIQVDAGVSNVGIDGNSFQSIPTGISLRGGKGTSVGPNNTYELVTNPVRVESGATNYMNVAPQKTFADGLIVTNLSTVSHYDPLINYDYRRAIPNTTSGATDSTLWRLEVGTYQAGEINLRLSGSVAGVGAYIVAFKRTVTRAGSGAATVATPTGWTDISVGSAPPVVTFDTATVAGEVQVKVRLGSSGTDVQGIAHVTYDGALVNFRQGA